MGADIFLCRTINPARHRPYYVVLCAHAEFASGGLTGSGVTVTADRKRARPEPSIPRLYQTSEVFFFIGTSCGI